MVTIKSGVINSNISEISRDRPYTLPSLKEVLGTRTVVAYLMQILLKIMKKKPKGIIFSANIDRCRANPLIYVKYWKQVCLPLSYLVPRLSLSLQLY